MARKYSPYPIKDLGLGIDTYSAKSDMQPGMLTDVLNLDPESNGTISTRKGYERYYGGIPLRARVVNHIDDKITFQFDEAQSIALLDGGVGPLVVTGKLSPDNASVAGDFSGVFSSVWYDTYRVTFRENFESGTPATKNKNKTATGVSSSTVFFEAATADNPNTAENTRLTMGDASIDSILYDVTLSYYAYSDFTGFFYFLEVPATSSLIYIEEFAVGDWTLVGGSYEISVVNNTHGLNTLNLICRVYEKVGDDYFVVDPEDILINTITATLTVRSNSTFEGRVIFYAAPDENNSVATIPNPSPNPGEDENTIYIPVDESFHFMSVWVKSQEDSDILLEATPEDVRYNPATGNLEVKYISTSDNPEVVYVNTVVADYLGNVIEVTDSNGVSANYTDEFPEVTVWGIEHDSIYRSAAVAGGYVNHIDNYNSDDKETIVTGLGGNVFQATSYEQGAVTYQMASAFARGASRTKQTVKLAPLFASVGTTFARTRGLVTDENVEGNYARVTSVEWVSDNYINYTLSFASSVDVTSKVSVSDRLTVINCGYDDNNGVFKINSIIQASGTEIIFQVINTLREDAFRDEVNIIASANVFTDRVIVEANTEFISGDEIGLSAVDTRHTVVASAPDSPTSTLFIDNITSPLSIAVGLNVFRRRTSAIIPLRKGAFASVEDVVRGDMVRVTGYDRLFRVKQVNVEDTANVTIVVADGVASISKTAHKINPGSIILLFNIDVAGITGEQITLSSSTLDIIRFATTAPDGTYTGAKLLGRTIELDESILYEAGPDITVVTVDGRWVTIENPSTSSLRAITTKVHHFDEEPYTNQAQLKSAVVTDSMYFTNGFDEVKKFDGVSLMNAGLPPFQAWAFATVRSDIPSLPAGLQDEADFSEGDFDSKFFNVSTGILKAGQRFKVVGTDIILTVSEVVDAPAAKKFQYDLYFVEDLTEQQKAQISDVVSGGSVQLTGSTIYRYYVTCRMQDRNDQTIVSVTLGSEDLYVETFTSSAIELKILAMPVYPELDYDRIDVEVYRTLGSAAGVGAFYRVARERINYDNSTGYITIIDTVLDAALTIASLDKATTNFSGGNPNLTWTQPPKAKAMTTADNRLVLGNISSPPKADIVFRKNSNIYDLCLGDFHGGEIRFVKLGVNDVSANADLVFSFEGAGHTEITPASDITIGTNKITIASTAHGLVAGQWVYLFHRGKGEINLLRWAGWWRVDAVTTNAFEIKVAHTEAVGSGNANDVNCYVSSSSSSSSVENRVPLWMGQNASRQFVESDVNVADDTITISPHGCFTGMAVQFKSSRTLPNPLAADTDYYVISVDESTIKLATTYDNAIVGTAINLTNDGNGTHVIFPAILDGNFNQVGFDTIPLEALVANKLSVAISAVMATEDPANNYWLTLGTYPKPWLLSQAGQAFGLGEIYVQQFDAPNGGMSITVNGLSSRVSVYINNLLYANNEAASTQVKVFNSRLVYSYSNSPELFDDVYQENADSANVIDINPADGQEITAVIPFFGTSVFGAAQYAQSLVVFKTNSIYYVDLRSRQAQKIQTQGQGCTAPNSIALSTNGIFFANDSGLYHLDWSNKISWRGRFLNGIWNNELNKDQIARLAGHNYRQGRKYKLSYPTGTNTNNSRVLVYDHSREDLQQVGSWTIYDSHNATGWCNQRSDAFWGTTNGKVMKVRNTNTKYDYRDDDQPIAQSFTLGGTHYGLPNERKITDSVTIQFQNDLGAVTGINILTEQSLSGIFNASGTVTIPEGDTDATIRFSLPDRKGTHVRTRVVKDAVKDEKMQVSAVTYGVVSVGAEGVPQTNKFRR